MKVTLKNIAKISGLSCTAVSMALREDKRLPEKTRQKVIDIARELNYIPNSFARALQSNRSMLIGLMIHYLGPKYSIVDEIISSIANGAAKIGYGLLLSVIGEKRELMERQLKLFTGKGIDGLIVLGEFENFQVEILGLEKKGIPVVTCSNEFSVAPITNVMTDNRMGGSLAAEHLISLGHKKLAFCFCKNKLWNANRWEGAVLAARKHAISVPEPFHSPEEFECFIRQNRHNDPVTGMICDTDEDALTVKRLIEKTGLKVPDNISIVGFNNLWFTSFPEFDFSTIDQPKQELGEKAIELLIKKINGEKFQCVKLTPKLIKRGSSAAPVTLKKQKEGPM